MILPITIIFCFIFGFLLGCLTMYLYSLWLVRQSASMASFILAKLDRPQRCELLADVARTWCACGEPHATHAHGPPPQPWSAEEIGAIRKEDPK